MKKLIRQGVIAMLLAPLAFAIEAVSAVHGTISKIDSATRTIVVKAADGTEHTLRFVAKTAVHGTEATAKDSFHGLTEGTEVVAHYTAKGTDETAVEVDKVGKDGMKSMEGTISQLDRKGKKLAVKSADGTEQTFKLADHAAEDSASDLDRAAEHSAKVTVYYTQDAGKKVAHFFEKH
jgi:hypothetical protein